MKDREIHDESNVWCMPQRSKDFMLMLDLNEAIDLLAIANSVRWYGHVLQSEDGLVLRMALDFLVEGQRKKWRLKRQFEEESVKVGLRMEDALCQSMWSVGVNHNCCWVEVNLATLTYWGYYQILKICVYHKMKIFNSLYMCSCM